MAAVNRRSRVLEGECLECLVECFERGGLRLGAAALQEHLPHSLLRPSPGPGGGRGAGNVSDIVKKCREPSLEAWDREYPSVKYCERGDSEKHGVGRLVRGYVFLTMRAMELMFQHAKLIHQAGTWSFPEPALRPGWGQQGHINYCPITAMRYQHPALTKAVAGFVTYGDHAACLEKQAKARAKRAAQQERRALEQDYFAKRNERLRMLVVPGGRERLATDGN
eukprot:jgi/Tetstr1/425851/TSEL_016228.t1